MNAQRANALHDTPLANPTDLEPTPPAISPALNILLADMFGRYVKTKNFHWHMSGPHFRDYHRQADVRRSLSHLGPHPKAARR
jgi:starvation-inducible DNA-binding protein